MISGSLSRWPSNIPGIGKTGQWTWRATSCPCREIAEALGRKIGRHVQYAPIPWDEFERHAGSATTLMYRWLQDVGFQVDIAALRYEHPNMMAFERWLQSNWRPKWQTA